MLVGAFETSFERPRAGGFRRQPVRAERVVVERKQRREEMRSHPVVEALVGILRGEDSEGAADLHEALVLGDAARGLLPDRP